MDLEPEPIRRCDDGPGIRIRPINGGEVSGQRIGVDQSPRLSRSQRFHAGKKQAAVDFRVADDLELVVRLVHARDVFQPHRQNAFFALDVVVADLQIVQVRSPNSMMP